MGQKVNPHGLRIGIIKDWDSKWYAEKEYADYLVEDHKLREYLKGRLYSAGISNIEIERASKRVRFNIHTAKPGIIIGKGGEVINKITSETGTEVDIKEDGLITIASPNGESIEKALNWIKSLVEEPEVGKIYEGKVVSIKDFGAFVNILPGVDGMVHISKLADHRVAKVTDVVKEGQTVRVKITGIDERGKMNLTMIGL